MQVLDHGYVELVDVLGNDQSVVEAARMSNDKGFLGWGPICEHCGGALAPALLHADPRAMRCKQCGVVGGKPGDEKLLKFLWDKQHTSPFEMGDMVIEVKAPLMVFREWHRHRTQSYNETSARYIPLPDENYVPTVERCLAGNQQTTNKQAQSASAHVTTETDALEWLAELADVYDHIQRVYDSGLRRGIPKELARLPVPVARYSRMRAKANLLNWLKFLKLRCDPAAQWEIRQYAAAVAELVQGAFPRTYAVAREGLNLPV